MAARRHRSKPTRAESPSVVPTDGVEVPVQERRDVLDGLDELLDEIDEALESNAEEFVRNYVQKGGQ